MPTTEEILNNVVWLVNALDEDALGDVQDIPFLEMAQVVMISPLRLSSLTIERSRRKHVRPRYPTSMKNAFVAEQAEKLNERRPLL